MKLMNLGHNLRFHSNSLPINLVVCTPKNTFKNLMKYEKVI